MGRAGARKGSSEWKARVSSGLRRHHERRRQEARVRPRDLDRLQASGSVAPSLRPLLAIAGEEAIELIAALGGPDQISPQRRITCGNWADDPKPSPWLASPGGIPSTSRQ